MGIKCNMNSGIYRLEARKMSKVLHNVGLAMVAVMAQTVTCLENACACRASKSASHNMVGLEKKIKKIVS